MSTLACPLCRQATVTIGRWSFNDTTVTVPVCRRCYADTGTISLQIKTSGLADLALPSPAIRHHEGLLEFTSALAYWAGEEATG